jgi:hypothetical protein
MPRTLCLLLVLLGSLVSTASADEVVVLDNGAVLMGSVVREDAKELTLRLSGTRKLALITLDKEQVTRRIPADMPKPTRSTVPDVSDVHGRPAPAPVVPPSLDDATEVPAEEPSIQAEGFFERLARVAIMAMPSNQAGLGSMGVLFFLALLAIVAMGARLAEIESLTFVRALLLAGLLGGFVAADVAFPHDLLRADRARWVLPVEGLGWIAAAATILRESLGRTILLFAFVLFSASVVLFTAGAILVTF